MCLPGPSMPVPPLYTEVGDFLKEGARDASSSRRNFPRDRRVKCRATGPTNFPGSSTNQIQGADHRSPVDSMGALDVPDVACRF